jgi:hypothetical protein
VLAQPAALGLILIMLRAIQNRIFVSHTVFCGESGSNGWSYDTVLVAMNWLSSPQVVVATPL